MKTTSSRIVAVALGLLASTQFGSARIWVDSTGRHKTDAEFVAVKGGNVSLKTPTGRIISLPLAKLRALDRAHALQLAAAAKGTAPDEAPVSADRADRPTISEGTAVTAEGELRPVASFSNGKEREYVSLIVEVSAVGGVAAEAYAVGPVTAKPVMINGRAHEAQEDIGEDGFEVIDRSAKGVFAEHPGNGVSIEVDYGEVPEDTRKAGPVTGSVLVLAGGTEKVSKITDLLTRSTTDLEDAALKSAGVTAKFIRQKQGDEMEVGVEMTGSNAEAFVALELIDGQGKIVASGGGSMRSGGTVQFTKYASKEVLNGATLRLRFRDGARKVEIPFNLPEVRVGK